MTPYSLTQHITLLLFVLLLGISGIAQTYSFRHFTAEDGLPSSEIHDVVQDNKGFMWFATDRGLVRFDGYEFETYTTQNGLVDNVLLHLRKDEEGKIWFAGYSGRIGFIDKGEIYNFPYNELIHTLIESPLITSFEIGTNDHIYIGTKSSGYLEIDTDGNFFLDTTATHCHNLRFVENKAIFYKTYNSDYPNLLDIRCYDNGSPLASKHAFSSSENYKISASTGNLGDGSYLISEGKSIYRISNKLFQKVYTAKHDILSLSLTKNEVWVGLIGGGCLTFNIKNKRAIEQSSLASWTITSCYQDIENGLWITTLEEGLFYLPSKAHFSLISVEKNRHFSIHQMALLNNHLYVYNTAEQLTIVNVDSSFHLKRVQLIEENFKFLCADSHIYLNGYLNLFQVENFEAKQIIEGYNSIYCISPNTFLSYNLSGNHLEFGRYNSEINTFTPFKIDRPYIYRQKAYKGFINNSGTIYIYSKEGVSSLAPLGDENYKRIDLYTENDLLGSRIVQMVNYPNFDFIAATKGNGLLFHKEDSVFAITEKNGLLSDMISSIKVDEKNNIWVGTSQGLSLIDQAFNITNLRMEDGLISNEVTALAVDSNNVYVGTKKGLTVLDKNHIDKQEVLIPVFIKSIELKGVEKQVPENNQLSISYKEPYININFVGISYKSMGRIRYRYRLQQEDGWQYTSNTTLLFNNLGSGKYTLEIQATNGDNNWDSPITSLNIFVTYPFWRTTPFYVIAILSFLSLFYLFYKLSITRIKNKEAIKHQIQNLRFEALSAQMNPHFMFNSLNAIQNFIMQNEKKSSVRYLSKFAKLMRITLNHSQAKNITLAEELSALELYLQLEQLRFDHQFDFAIETSKNLETDKTIFPALLIQPIVENAILHGIRPAKRKGHIVIKLHLGKSGLHISIRDNGVGRNLDKTAQNTKKKDGHISKGSLMTQERVALFAKENKGNHSYEIIDHNENGAPSGTEVKILLPFVYLLKVNAE